MNFQMGVLHPVTTITDGIGGNSFNSMHLISTYGLDKPHDLSAGSVELAQIFSASDRYQDKPLIAATEAKGKKIYLKSNQFTWKLRAHQKQRFRIMEVVETAARPGENETLFSIVLDKGWLREPDVISGEHNEYPLEIVGEPMQRGLGWEYRVRMQDSSNGRYFPSTLFAVGREFWKVSTSVADEMNEKYGTIQFNSIFELRSHTGNVAEKLQFTDRALRVDINNRGGEMLKYWNVPFLDNNGKRYNKFVPMAEAEMMNQVYEDIEWALNYGRKSIRKGPNGYLKRTPAGLRQQLEDAHQLLHNGNLTLSRLEEWLNGIYYGRKDATPASRSIVLSTGEMGAKMFDQMVKSEISNFLTVDSHFIRSGGDFRHLSFGVQFTHYVGINGLDVTVMLNPHNDNPDYCPQMHPVYNDKTIDSWRMDILDFGTTREQTTGAMGDNISFVCEDNADYYFTTFGKHDPKTGLPINDGSQGLAGGVGGYTTQIEKSYGLLIRDITRCGVVKLNLDTVY